MGISGDTIVVGAGREGSNAVSITNGATASANNSATGAGAAYAFLRSSTEWTQQAHLKALNAEKQDYFGGGGGIGTPNKWWHHCGGRLA